MTGRLAAPGSHRQSMVSCRDMNVLCCNMNVLCRNMNVLCSNMNVLCRNMLSCVATCRNEEATSSCHCATSLPVYLQLPMPSTDGAI